MSGSVRSIATGESNPIRHHGAEGDTAAGYATDEAAVEGRRYLGEVDGNGGDHASVTSSASFPLLMMLSLYMNEMSLMVEDALTYPTAYPANTLPARNIPKLTAAVWTIVPIVTIIHINCMNRILPNLSPIKVCVRAPSASPAM